MKTANRATIATARQKSERSIFGALVGAEHGDVAWLVAGARRKDLVLLLPLRLRRRHTGLLQRIRSSLCGKNRDKVGELLGLQGEELVAGLSCLQSTTRRLA